NIMFGSSKATPGAFSQPAVCDGIFALELHFGSPGRGKTWTELRPVFASSCLRVGCGWIGFGFVFFLSMPSCSARTPASLPARGVLGSTGTHSRAENKNQ